MRINSWKCQDVTILACGMHLRVMIACIAPCYPALLGNCEQVTRRPRAAMLMPCTGPHEAPSLSSNETVSHPNEAAPAPSVLCSNACLT